MIVILIQFLLFFGIMMDSKMQSMKDFEIVRELGSGSFGKVDLVKKISDQQIYALKSVLMTRLTEKEKDSALNEIRLLASINIPNVIRYKGSFYNSPNQSLCIVMEYADGGDLEGKITQKFKNHDNEGFEENFIWKVAFEIFQGLKSLHSNKIIHRDIKSANIFFVDGIAKLGDLNVSKVAESGMCSTQTGTPYYTSPEIWKGSKYGRKCDIWSTGCVLYQMCTLNPPFKAKDFPGLFRKVVVGNYSPIPSHYSYELNELIRMCLTVDEDLRPDAIDLLETTILSGMELNLEKFRSDQGEIKLIDPIKCPRVLRFLNSKLPQAKFEVRAKKTVGFSTKKQIEGNDEKSTIKPSKYLKKVKSEKLIIISDEKTSIKNAPIANRNKIKLPPLDCEDGLKFSGKRLRSQLSEKRIASKKVIIADEKQNCKVII